MNLLISRFYDITHETVVTPATDFGYTCTEKMLNNFFSGLVTILFSSFICIIGYKLTTHNIS